MEFKKIFLFAAILILMPCLCFSSDFTDNGDGTITDNKTGLMWMQETAPHPHLSGSLHQMNWKDALSYCENLEYAGYSDWRLPNIKELDSIVDNSTYNPAIDTNFFPDTMSLYYWSSTTSSHYTGNAWLVDFYSGFGSNSGKSNTYYVRAVRGGQ